MKGYSLLELSIVVIVIALLMAASTTGSKILQRSQILATTKQMHEIEAAIISFQERYYALPGDFSGAYRYFDNGSSTICGNLAECNGDGDGMIELGSKKSESESFRAWQHLELAKLIRGNFSGEWGVGEYFIRARLDGNFTLIYDNQLHNILKLGSFSSISNVSDAGLLLPETAEKIDLKIDDGAPHKGFIRAMGGFLGGDKEDPTNYSQNCYSDVYYNVSMQDDTSCILAQLIQ